MFTLYQIKPKFQNLLRPLVAQLAARQVTPNQVTISAMVLAIAMGLAIACFPQHQWILLALPIVLLVRMALNAIDGMLAREYDMATPLGCVLNELGDIIADVALYLPFAMIPGSIATQVVTIVILAVLTEGIGFLGLLLMGQRQYQGPMGKSDRALLFGILGILFGLKLDLLPWLHYLWNGVILFQIWTVINRILPIVPSLTALLSIVSRQSSKRWRS